MKRLIIGLFAVAVIFQSDLLFSQEQEVHRHDEATEQDVSHKVTHTKKYACPIHADVQSDKPGECPKCGMTFKQAVHEEVSEEDSHKGHNHTHH
jgi:predicted Zn-ribbon and HTH transcriptional regulator